MIHVASNFAAGPLSASLLDHGPNLVAACGGQQLLHHPRETVNKVDLLPLPSTPASLCLLVSGSPACSIAETVGQQMLDAGALSAGCIHG